MFKLNSTHKWNGIAGLDALTSMRANARNGLIAYGDIYDQLAEWGAGQDGVDRASIAWLRGAADVNRGEGVFSDFIRDYTSHQHFLRYGTALTAQDIQTLSDNIAESVIAEILNSHNNPSLADIPTLSVIGQNDAGNVIDSNFNQDITAWSGVVLFPFLGDRTFLNEMLSDTNATSTYRVIAALNSLTTAVGGVNPLEALQLFGQMVANYFSPGYGPSFRVAIDVADDLTTFVSSAYGRDDYLSNFFADVVLGRVGNHVDTLHLTEGGNIKLVHGGPGDDVIIADALSGFGHVIDGGDGEDTLDLSIATSDLEVSSDAESYVGHRILFDGGILSEDTVLVNTEHLVLGSGDDNVTISQSIASSLQTLATGDGNDVVNIISINSSPAIEVDLGAGDDEFTGGYGNEMLRGGTGNDNLDGGAGNDTVHVNGNFGDDVIENIEVITIDNIKFEGGIATDADRDGIFRLNEFDIEKKVGGLLLTRGDNSILIKDWDAESKNFGIILKENGDPIPGTSSPGSFTQGSAWYKVETTISQQFIALSREVRFSGSEGYHFFYDYLTAEQYAFLGKPGIYWELGWPSRDGSAPSLGETYESPHNYNMKGYWKSGVNVGLPGFMVTGFNVSVKNHRITEVVIGEGIGHDTPPVSVTTPNETVFSDTRDYPYPTTHNYGYYTYRWFYGTVNLNGGITTGTLNTTLVADGDGGTLRGTTGNNVFEIKNAPGNHVIDGDGGIDQIKVAGNFGNVNVTNGEQIFINGTQLTGQATYDINTQGWTLNGYTIRLGSLIISSGSNSIHLSDWSVSNNYGITFGSAPITGTANADVLVGTGDNEIIHGLAGNDRLDGGAGADSLLGDAGNDSLDGGSDTDWLNFAAATQAVTVDLQNGSATGFFGTDQLASIEAVLGGNSADSLRGDAGSNTLHGGAGADTMAGGAGNDLFFVTDAGDLVMELAGSGADTIIAS
ncbi:MAG: hypothetical protein IM482_14120, partial [Microcystis sp. M043S2]|nr:hypothetical protein [Microcystis sp. M043S2]